MCQVSCVDWKRLEHVARSVFMSQYMNACSFLSRPDLQNEVVDRRCLKNLISKMLCLTC